MSAKKSQGKKKNPKTVQETPIENINVKLKPILGIQPRSYLPVVWGLILIIILFLLLVLPGIRHNGSYITVQTLPADASVIVDGIRLGTSGDEVFVKKGLRKLTVSRVGFEKEERNIDVSGRIFASRLFPLKKEITVKLKPQEGYNHLSAGIENFAEWAATGPEEGRYAIPPVLTQTARDLLQSGAAGETAAGKAVNEAEGAEDNTSAGDAWRSAAGGAEIAEELTRAALPLSIDERQLADILRARFMLESGGAPLSVSSLVSFIDSAARESAAINAARGVAAESADQNNADQSSTENPGKLAATLALVNEDRLSSLGLEDPANQINAEEKEIAAKAQEIYNTAISSNSFPAQLLAGRKFISIPALTLPIGDMEAVNSGYNPRSGARPVMAAPGAFYISSVEVSNRDFAAFISANPDWGVGNREELIARGLADEDYLKGWGIASYPPGSAAYPVTDISWYAAEAYTEWFTQRYLKGSGLHARLPREDEWEAAARLNGIAQDSADFPQSVAAVDKADSGRIGISGMAGNVREWALNPYRYNENLFRPADGSPGYQDPSDPLAAPERPVRGGAFIDRNLFYPAAVRGGLKPEITSPVIGFRMVIVQD